MTAILTKRGAPRQRDYVANRVKRGASPAERILHHRIITAAGCWELDLAIDKYTGYGVLSIDGKGQKAHRVSYQAFVGPIPAGLEIDHLCRNRACCNPDHLEAVSPLVNTRRSPFCRSYITHCPRGHEYDETNTYVTPKNQRQCRTCCHVRGVLWRAMTPEQRQARKDAGLVVVDLDAYFADVAAA